MDKATWWGIIVNLLLSIGKLIVGYIGHSPALLADGLHSLSDLVSDGMVLFATHHSNIEADEDHPYGHARYETFATITLAVLLCIVGLGIGVDAIQRLINYQDIPIPAQMTLVIAGISILSKEVLYQYTMKIARRVKSKLLEANAWHHRSDAISSIVVFVGISGAILGFPLLDSVAAIIVALMICKIGWDLGHQSFQELVDTGLDHKTLQDIEKIILSINGVDHMHMLRTRTMGHAALADVHIQVAPKLSVSEGHQISEAVEIAIIDQFSEVTDVTVHIDPEDDEHAENSCKHLPLRDAILGQLEESWSKIPEIRELQETTLHYLNGAVNIELVFPLKIIDSGTQPEQLKQQLSTASKQLDCIGLVDVLFK